jgi:hypothetical protein
MKNSIQLHPQDKKTPVKPALFHHSAPLLRNQPVWLVGRGVWHAVYAPARIVNPIRQNSFNYLIRMDCVIFCSAYGNQK